MLVFRLEHPSNQENIDENLCRLLPFSHFY